MKNQKGVVHLLIPIILIIGVIVTVYLVTSGNPLKLFSSASNEPIVFKNVDGSALSVVNSVPQTTSPTVKVELTSPLGEPVFETPPPVSPSPSASACPAPPVCTGGQQLVTGDPNPSDPNRCPRYSCNPTNSPSPSPSSSPSSSKPRPCGAYGDINNDGVITQDDANLMNSEFIVANGNVGSDLADLNKDGKTTVADLQILLRYLAGHITTFPVCSVLGVATGSSQISGTVSFKFSETPTGLDTASVIPYREHPYVNNYTFRDSTPGQKFLWVEFIDVVGRKERRSAQIQIVAISPSPSPSLPPATERTSPCGNYGDVDGNARVGVNDFWMTSQAITNKLTLTADQQRKANVNGNGSVDIGDALLIWNYTANSISTFPVCNAPGSPQPSVSPSPSPSASPVSCNNIGDVNGDGRVDIIDASLTLRSIGGTVTLTTDQQRKADVDGNGRITVDDVQYILRYVTRNITTFPACSNR